MIVNKSDKVLEIYVNDGPMELVMSVRSILEENDIDRKEISKYIESMYRIDDWLGLCMRIDTIIKTVGWEVCCM